MNLNEPSVGVIYSTVITCSGTEVVKDTTKFLILLPPMSENCEEGRK